MGSGSSHSAQKNIVSSAREISDAVCCTECLPGVALTMSKGDKLKFAKEDKHCLTALPMLLTGATVVDI